MYPARQNAAYFGCPRVLYPCKFVRKFGATNLSGRAAALLPMNGGLHGDMVRTLNNALAQAVQATTAVEKERDEAIQGRQLMAKSLATITDKAASLQALLEQERATAASRLQSLSAEHEAAQAAEREVERRRRSALEEELEASRQRVEKLDSELWRHAEQTVDAGSRLGGLQQEVTEERGLH